MNKKRDEGDEGDEKRIQLPNKNKNNGKRIKKGCRRWKKRDQTSER